MSVKTLSLLLVAGVLAVPSVAAADAPKPGTLEYIQRDMQNMQDAYGRQTAPDGQFNNREYEIAQTQESNDVGFKQTQKLFQFCCGSVAALKLSGSFYLTNDRI